MKTLTLLSLILALLSGCYSKVNDQVDPGEKSRTINSKEACERGECPCDTPVGTINHGSKISTYSKPAVQCDQGCAAFSRESTCNNGVLSPAPENGYPNYRCQVAECPACTLEGNLILSGETVDTYSKEEVGCRESCEDFKQERTCNLGTLSGSANYHYFNCHRKVCRCELPDSSGFVSLDGTVKLYNTQQASCGSTCELSSKIRTCKMSTTNGNDTFYLDENAAYRYRTCQEATNCVCTLPNNLGIMTHGQVKTVSTVASVTCGNLCSAQPSVTVKCDNGIFRNNSNLTQVIDFSTPAYQTYKYFCQAQDCVACQVPGTSTSVMHGDYYRFFRNASVGCSETCEDQNRQCFNGAFLPAGSPFNAPTCQRRSCTCNVPGVPGVTIPVGSNWLFYSAANAQCGQTCAQLSTPKTCTEVFSGGNYTYEFQGAAGFTNSQCSPATGCSCLLPGTLGQIDHNKTVILTSLNPVPCGTTCDQAPSISLKCDNGIMIRTTDGSPVNVSDPTFPYKYFCKTGTCSDCSLPGYGTIANNSQITLFSKSVLVCGDHPEDFTFNFQCQNGALLKNGNPYTPNGSAPWYTSYTVNCPGCDLPWGGKIAIGADIMAYKYFGTVINGCGRGCKGLQRHCGTNGILDGDTSYNLSQCDNNCSQIGGGAPPRVCLLRNQNIYVTPDSQIPIWKKRSVACGESCQSNYKVGSCDMLTGTFKSNGELLPFDYIYDSCTEVCP